MIGVKREYKTPWTNEYKITNKTGQEGTIIVCQNFLTYETQYELYKNLNKEELYENDYYNNRKINGDSQVKYTYNNTTHHAKKWSPHVERLRTAVEELGYVEFVLSK